MGTLRGSDHTILEKRGDTDTSALGTRMGWAGSEVLLDIMLGMLLLCSLLAFQLKARSRMKSVHLALVSPQEGNRREKLKMQILFIRSKNVTRRQQICLVNVSKDHPSPPSRKQVTKESTGNILWHLLFTNLEIQKQGSP